MRLLSGSSMTWQQFKTRVAILRISHDALRWEVMMFDQRRWKSGVALVATALALAVLTAGHALASQGPGGGPGTAGAITQTVMAIMVYGGSAAIVAVALIGALRHR
jgi:uncharacterized membrane protein